MILILFLLYKQNLMKSLILNLHKLKFLIQSKILFIKHFQGLISQFLPMDKLDQVKIYY